MQTALKVSEISIDDKECFDRYFKMANLQISELNFTNFFMWRDHYKIRFSIVSDFLCIISVIENKPFCFFPIGDYSNSENLKTAIYVIQEYFSELGCELVFSRVSANQVSALEGLGLQFVANEDRDNFDYIYSVKSL